MRWKGHPCAVGSIGNLPRAAHCSRLWRCFRRSRRAHRRVPPTNPIARNAYDVLDKHCARCHQEGRLIDRDKPAKNFGNILKLDEIAASPHYILPGNALGSKLFRQIADREMPYDVAYEGDARYPHVTADDLQALERWIVSLGARATAACANRTSSRPRRPRA